MWEGPSAFSVPEQSNERKKTPLIKEIFDVVPFQDLVGCTVTGACGGGLSIEIELDNQRVLSCYAYDYLKKNKYLYSLHQLQES